MKQCGENNIAFSCFPPNSTHLCQPLDVAFFQPLKTKWRTLLASYKATRGKKVQTIQKDRFPRLLKQLIDSLVPTTKFNLQAGFRKTRIFSLDPEPVLNRLSQENEDESVNTSVTGVFVAQS